MPKVKKKRKADPLKDLPRFRHDGDPPAELVKIFNFTYRTIARNNHKIFSRRQWKRFRSMEPDALIEVFDIVVGAIPHKHLDRFTPPWQCDIQSSKLTQLPTTVRWWKVATSNIKRQTIYHAHSRPKITLPNTPGQWQIGFSFHAVTRMMERMNIASNHGRLSIGHLYKCNGSVIAKPDIQKGEEGFWLWSRDATDAWTQRAVLELLHQDPKDFPTGRHYVRVAWCPVDLVGKFAMAKTALAPAMLVPGINVTLTTNYEWTQREIAEWHKLHAVMPMVQRVPENYLGVK